jgi:hypothetical protein
MEYLIVFEKDYENMRQPGSNFLDGANWIKSYVTLKELVTG